MSQNDIKFLKILKNGASKLENVLWCLPLPFKENTALPNNKVQAERRLEQLLSKLNRDPEHKEYCMFMSQMIKNGQADPVSEDAE